jgi:hypothetical protein
MTDADRYDALMANMSKAGTFAMLGWVDPLGNWWMAPLGTPAPDPDQAMPVAWVPIKTDYDREIR